MTLLPDLNKTGDAAVRIKTLLTSRRRDGAPPEPGAPDVDLRRLQSQETAGELQPGQRDGGAEGEDPADGENIEVGTALQWGQLRSG